MERDSFYLGDKFWTKHLVADVRLMNSDRGVVLVFLSKKFEMIQGYVIL